MIYGYIRVSSDRQTTANQKYEIAVFCERENISIDKWVEETISGTRDYGQRKLGALLRKVKAGDMIVCTELSHLGRRPGSRNRAYKLDSRAALINRMLREGKSRRTIARHCKVAKSTLDRWLKLSATDNCPAANMPDYQPITETPPPSRPPGEFA